MKTTSIARRPVSQRPGTVAEMLTIAASWLDMADRAFIALAAQRGEVKTLGKEVQTDLRTLADVFAAEPDLDARLHAVVIKHAEGPGAPTSTPSAPVADLVADFNGSFVPDPQATETAGEDARRDSPAENAYEACGVEDPRTGWWCQQQIRHDGSHQAMDHAGRRLRWRATSENVAAGLSPTDVVNPGADVGNAPVPAATTDGQPPRLPEGPSLEDTDRSLIGTLRALADSYGASGVALTVHQLWPSVWALPSTVDAIDYDEAFLGGAV